jgi:alpha-galactosidase
MECRVTFFTSFVSPITEYEAYLRIDESQNTFVKAVQNVEKWWESDFGYTHAYVPEAAKMPMNSAWYSFHQALDPEKIIEECKLSAPLGMDTIILDDGWQTDDNNRGYKFCGDWELATKKIPDMKALTDAIHQTGMKVMLWFSVPFVGMYSKAYERFKDKALTERDGVLTVDVRYKEVRDYLVDIYKNAVISYGLDGLKLDFIDQFRLSANSPAANDQMDIPSVEDAVDALLKETKSALSAIDPEVLVEFRQSYIGPTILKYGNMVRVGDCPYDSLRNRMGIVDLRLTSGNTAVHSDMIMWHKDAPVESAANQMISTLFGVPQVSVMIKDLPQDHKKALKFWLDFYRSHVDVLHSEDLSVKNPEMHYSQVKTRLNGSSVAVNYANVPFDVEPIESDCEAFLINSTYENYVCVNALENMENVSITVRDCMGNTVSNEVLNLSKGISVINVPKCGLVEIRK